MVHDCAALGCGEHACAEADESTCGDGEFHVNVVAGAWFGVHFDDFGTTVNDE